MNFIISGLFPNFCVSCSVECESALCYQCWSKVEFLSGNICNQCGVPMHKSINQLCIQCSITQFLHSKRSFAIYDEITKSLIVPLKSRLCYRRIRTLGNWAYLCGVDIWKDIDIIVPIPSHWTKILQRGHNIPSYISEYISVKTQIDTIHSLKEKFSFNKQKGKTLKERQSIVQNKFYLRSGYENYVVNKNIALVDDVITTGATMSSAASVLLEHGARKVFCIAPLRTKIR